MTRVEGDDADGEALVPLSQFSNYEVDEAKKKGNAVNISGEDKMVGTLETVFKKNFFTHRPINETSPVFHTEAPLFCSLPTLWESSRA